MIFPEVLASALPTKVKSRDLLYMGNSTCWDEISSQLRAGELIKYICLSFSTTGSVIKAALTKHMGRVGWWRNRRRLIARHARVDQGTLLQAVQGNNAGHLLLTTDTKSRALQGLILWGWEPSQSDTIWRITNKPQRKVQERNLKWLCNDFLRRGDKWWNVEQPLKHDEEGSDGLKTTGQKNAEGDKKVMMVAPLLPSVALLCLKRLPELAQANGFG